MPTAPILYPKPQNPTGFMIFNPQFTKGTILFLHGIGGIGDGSGNPWGLQSLLPPDLHLQWYGIEGGRNEIRKELIEYAEQQQMVLIALQCDRPADQGGYTHQMVDNVLNHAVVRNYTKDTFHAIGFSLGGGELGNYLLVSGNAAKFATAWVCYMVQASGNFANIVSAKTLIVGVTATKDSQVSPTHTIAFVDSVNNAGANPRAIKKIFPSGDHGGALPEMYRNTPYPEFENMGMYDFMKAKSRGTTTPPIQPPPKVEDFKFIRGGKQIIGYTDKTWEEK